MNEPEREQLLREILLADKSADFREASLQRALSELRFQRRRRARRVSMMVMLPLVAALIIFFRPPSDDSDNRTLASNSTVVAESRSNPVQDGIEYINDEELFRLFPDRSLALIGSPGPGRQQAVFLDQRRPANIRLQ